MKKVVAMLLTASLLAVACVGCGSKADTQEPADTTKTEAPAETEEPAETEAPAETEEPAETEAPAETEEPAGAADGSYSVEVDIQGTATPVEVTVADGKYSATYSFMGNEVTLTGNVGAEWTVDDESVVPFEGAAVAIAQQVQAAVEAQ